MTKHIGIYLYPMAEVLDFSGPFEVFTTASRVCAGDEPFAVSLISETGGAVVARAGYRVETDFAIDRHPPLDALVVVGGVHHQEMEKPRVIDWIRRQASQIPVVASVCTGAFLLAKAGLCEGKRVTTHWEDIPDLKQQFPQLEVVGNVRWVDQGNLVTSGGISAGIDMSLHLVDRLYARSLAERTAKQMDFDWRENR
ncbi:transcriptional regulator GlxA family with amidase domain [Litorivivens lipolytica]|uniref:Transcriptional regulator GlxA family with amidase domain n=1 Tax=Litorivivens lipolytica TaxID=1524264 RepID=A0A7W4Z655_9GAMM|nr:DJ-1/PfpI family protein [Litorivivens lipolytica]MBB3047898.1 transcriptional regulator GlxA family with amidase domain [Litorivivens lipolytica]